MKAVILSRILCFASLPKATGAILKMSPKLMRNLQGTQAGGKPKRGGQWWTGGRGCRPTFEDSINLICWSRLYTPKASYKKNFCLCSTKNLLAALGNIVK